MDVRQKTTSARQRAQPLMFALCATCVAVPSAANAANFPVSGTISVNGNAGALPTGGTFGNSTYDATSGAISSGKFTFPQATLSFDSDIGTVTVTYTLSQTNTSTGQVANDGVAGLTQTQLKLVVDSARIGVIPIGIGTCVFQPINVDLDGTGAASGLDLDDDAFTIPSVATTDCGGHGDQVNAGVAGSNNTIQVHIAGNFTPPPEDDTIFANGFDPAGLVE
jgi:hypothetical protein